MDLLTVPRPVTSLGPRRFSLKGYSGKKMNELKLYSPRSVYIYIYTQVILDSQIKFTPLL